MANAFKTSDAHLFIGKSSAIHDLTRSASGVEVGGSANVEAITTLGNSDVEKVPLNTSTEFTIGTMYHGEATDILFDWQGDDDVYMALMDSVNSNAYAGKVQWTGSEQSAPTDNIISDSVTIFQNGLLSAGHGAGRVTAFEFKVGMTSDVTINLTFPNTDRVFAVVTEAGGNGETLVLGKSGATAEAEAATTGIHEFDISGFAASIASPTLSTKPTPTGSDLLKGFILVLTNLGLD